MTCPYAGNVELEKPDDQNVSMSGTVISADGQLTIDRNIPVPIPKCTEVIIKVFAAGITSYDCQIMTDSTKLSSETSCNIPGSDVTGFIHNLGRGVTQFKIGQPVYTVMTPGFNGGYAEYMAVKQEHVFPLNSSLTFSQGAALGVPYFTAYKALFLSGNAKPLQTVLILGANGSIGTACCQLASANGMTVIASASTPSGLDVAHDHGANALINSTDEHFCQKIQKYTKEKGVDLLIDTGIIENEILSKVVDVVANDGTIVTVRGRKRETFSDNTQIHIENINVMDFPQAELSEIAPAINAYIEEGVLKPYIGDEFPLKQLPEAYKQLQHPESVNGHVIISMN